MEFNLIDEFALLNMNHGGILNFDLDVSSKQTKYKTIMCLDIILFAGNK